MENREKLEKEILDRGKGKGKVDEEWEEMKNRIEKVYGEQTVEVRGNKRGWWDEECREEKKK